MKEEDLEEQQLRSVALQNAQSILLARQRAEEELVRAKEDLEQKTQELAQSLAMMRATLESTTDGILVTDGAGKVTDFNEKYVSMWRVPREVMETRVHRRILEVIGQSFSNAPEFLARIDAIYASSPPESYDLLELADGRVFERISRIQFVADRNVGRVWSFRDITERNRAEDALRDSEHELADFFENASVGLHWVGSDGLIQRANRAELELLGYSSDEYVGRHIAEFHADQSVIEDILQRLSNDEILTNYEARMRCKDGSIKHVLIDSCALWQNGQFVRSRCFTRDNTDRKLAEEIQARLATIVESSQDAIISKALDSRIVSWNAAAERLFGYTSQEMVGQLITILIPSDRQDEERFIVDRLSRGEHIEHYETVRVAKDGRHIDISLMISPIRDKTGNVIGASKIARDITVRREADQALRESEAQFRQLANALPQIVWTARPDGFIDYYNDRWYEFTGFKRGDFGDQSWKPILHPDDLQRCIDTYYGCVQSEQPYQIEYRFKDRLTGGYRWFLGRAYPVRDELGRILRWFGTCTDIDDTKQAEETTHFLADASAALAELTDYRSTLQKLASLAVPFFADWCAVEIQEVDGAIDRLAVTHRDPDKVHLVLDIFRRYPPRPADGYGVMKVLRTNEPEWVPVIPDELLVASAQDEEHLKLIRDLGFKSYISTPLRSRGRTIGALTFAMAESGRNYDITDLAAAEDLAHRASIAIENASLVATLQDADRRKDEFLAMLAHELRNPLAPIRNAVQIYRGKAPPVPELQWATEVIERQVHQMTRLVDDLLDVSRITTGKIELRTETVELTTVINSAVEASRPLIEKRHHRLTLRIPSEPIFLNADPTRLAQVLLNLLNNASKYMDQGGDIDLIVERQPTAVLIRVKDTGIGIPAEMLPRIFEMFAQVDGSLERADGGLGIGLTLVRRLVEMHGGTIEAHSDGLGRGSEFVLQLPITHTVADQGLVAAVATAQPAVPDSLRILVVDDNRDAAESLALFLRMLGNEVRTAHDGLAAVGAAQDFRPEFVLLDIGLPKLNGYEVARQIRLQEGGPHIVLVALTGWGQEEDRLRSREAGFDHHMTKPVEFGALQKLLAQTTAGHAKPGRTPH